MTDAKHAVAQQNKTPLGKAIKVLDYIIRGLTLLALVPLTPIFVLSVGMGLNRNPLMGLSVLAIFIVMLGMLAISAIAPELFTRRLPLSGNARLLLSRLPVYLAFFLGIYFLATARWH
jgi:hypothetical protein